MTQPLDPTPWYQRFIYMANTEKDPRAINLWAIGLADKLLYDLSTATPPLPATPEQRDTIISTLTRVCGPWLVKQ